MENSQDTATYNRDGNVTTANTVSGTMKLTEQNTYDALGRIKTTTDEKNVVTSYGYDEFGRNNNTMQQFREKEQKQQLQFMMQMGELLKKQISPAEK